MASTDEDGPSWKTVSRSMIRLSALRAPASRDSRMTEAIEMGFRSLTGRTEAMYEGLTSLSKAHARTGKDFNDIMDLVRDMRGKVQDLIRMQDNISDQFKQVDKIVMGNSASDYEVKDTSSERTERRSAKKLSFSDDEDTGYKPTPRKPVTFDELSDEEPAKPAEPVQPAEPEPAVAEEIEVEVPEEAPLDAEQEAALAAEAAELARLEEEEAARKAAEEEEQLRREEEELAALEAEEAELLRLEEEEALRKEEEELRRLEEEEAEARRIAEEELRKLQEEEEAKKKAEEEAAAKKAEEEKNKKGGKFPPLKKQPGKVGNKFQAGGKNKVVFK